MNIYVMNAGGYNTIGTVVAAAETAEQAVEMANEASVYSTPGENFGGTMTYHNATIVGQDTGSEPEVLSIHEWGMPELPAKGSGIKVTF